MKKILTAQFILLLGVSNLGLAQEALSLTVQDAVELALEKNLSLQSEYIALGTREREHKAAWNDLIPSLSASGNLQRSSTAFSGDPPIIPGIPGITPDQSALPYNGKWSVGLALNSSLLLNIAVGTAIKQTKIDYEAGLLSYDEAQKKLSRDVRKTYYSLVAIKADLEIKAFNIELAESRYNQARINYNNGLFSELQMLQAQVFAENSKPTYNNQYTQYQGALMNFKLLLGIPSSTVIELSTPLVDVTFFEADPESLIERYSTGRLDILKINKAIESLENTKKLQAQGGRTPSLNLSLGWGTNVQDGFNSDQWQDGTWVDQVTLGIGLSVPLDSWIPFSNMDIALKGLQDEIDKLEFQRQLAHDAAEIEIKNLILSLENSMNTLKAYSFNVTLAQRTYDLTNVEYRDGNREVLDLEEAQLDLLRAQQNILYERYNYITTLLDLEFALNAGNIADILSEKE